MDADVTGSVGDAPRAAARWRHGRRPRSWPSWAGSRWPAQGPPRALPADAPAEDFSAGAGHAARRGDRREPHPLGSAAEEPVRAYIIDELKALGLEPEIQRPRDVRERDGPESESHPVAARRGQHRRPMARHGPGRQEGAVALGPL